MRNETFMTAMKREIAGGELFFSELLHANGLESSGTDSRPAAITLSKKRFADSRVTACFSLSPFGTAKSSLRLEIIEEKRLSKLRNYTDLRN